MGLWEFLRQWQRGRLVLGAVASLLVHVVVAWLVLWGLKGSILPAWVPKRGDTIIVELPRPEEPASAGSPTAAPPAPRPQPAPAVRPAPARPAPPRPALPPSPERRVAVAPRAPEPVTRARPEPEPRPAEPPPRPAEPVARPPEPAPSTAPAPPPTPAPAEPTLPAAPAPAAPRPGGGDSQVASLPPPIPSAPSAADVRAALRRGAGGHGQGRGGIEGDPIPLDSDNVQFSDYLEQVRRRISDKWGFPCVRKPGTTGCEAHTTSLQVEFGILKDGRLQFIDLVQAADHSLYDEYAMNAIRLAQPFPPVPPAMMAMRPGSAGIPIRARFIYVTETSLTKFLH